MTHQTSIPRLSQHKSELGQDLIEYALILPLLLMLLFGILEFGIAVFSFNTVANAAREGARVGIVPSTTKAQVIQATDRLTDGLGEITVEVEPDTDVPCGGDAETIQVVVTYDVQIITAKVLGIDATIPLRAQATMGCE